MKIRTCHRYKISELGQKTHRFLVTQLRRITRISNFNIITVWQL